MARTAGQGAGSGGVKAVGATVDRVLPTYTVMRDPEGNQFCLVDPRMTEMAAA